MTDTGKNIITSRRNPAVTEAAELKDKKRRDETGLFAAHGVKLCAEALKSGVRVRRLIACADKPDALFALLSQVKGTPLPEILYVSLSAFEKISGEKSPEGIIAIAEKPLSLHTTAERGRLAGQLEGEMVTALFSLRDPGNLGTAVRSALAFGYDRLVVTADSADLYNPKTLRASMGALFGMRVARVLSMEDFILECRGAGRRVFAAQKRENAIPLDGIRIEKSDIFIIGNEANGIPDAVADRCDGTVYIPIAKGCESLNASAAAAVLMWEQGRLYGEGV